MVCAIILSQDIYLTNISATLSATSEGSSRPLITALVMEMVSRNLRRKAPAAAALERAEYARRDRDMLWYLLRGSIWKEFTRYIFSPPLPLAY